MAQGLGQLPARFGAGFAPYQASGGSPIEAAARARLASGQKKKGQGQALGAIIGSFYGNPQAGAAIGGMAGGLAGGDDLSDIDFSSLTGMGGGVPAPAEAGAVAPTASGASTHPAPMQPGPTPEAPGGMTTSPQASSGFRALMSRSTPDAEEDEILTMALMNPQLMTALGGYGMG